MSKELILAVDNDPNSDVHAEGLIADNAPTFLDEVIVERKKVKKPKVEEVEVTEGGSDSPLYLQE